MTIRAGIFVIMTLCFAASPLLADEVLYCTDTAATGFKWDKSGVASAKPTLFNELRFIIKVVSDRERIIAPMIGDTAGISSSYACVTSFETTECEWNGGAGAEPWIFHGNTYTHAFLAGPPAGGGDPNIYLSYGTCTKF
jgi:hypothetical protein